MAEETISTGSVELADKTSLPECQPFTCRPVIFDGTDVVSIGNTSGIYYWVNQITGKGYVGQTLYLLKRIRKYPKHAKSQRHIYYAMVKYGMQNFKCYKIMDCCPSVVALNYWETYWIKELKTLSPDGYNLTTGGNNEKKSEETCKRISRALKGKGAGKRLTVEVRRKISESTVGKKNHFFGKHHSAKTIKRMIDNHADNSGENHPNWGKHHSIETRRKIGIKSIGRSVGLKRSIETKAKMRHSQHLRCNTVWKEFFVYDS